MILWVRASLTQLFQRIKMAQYTIQIISHITVECEDGYQGKVARGMDGDIRVAIINTAEDRDLIREVTTDVFRIIPTAYKY